MLRRAKSIQIQPVNPKIDKHIVKIYKSGLVRNSYFAYFFAIGPAWSGPVQARPPAQVPAARRPAAPGPELCEAPLGRLASVFRLPLNASAIVSAPSPARCHLEIRPSSTATPLAIQYFRALFSHLRVFFT